MNTKTGKGDISIVPMRHRKIGIIIIITAVAVVVLVWWFSLPDPLFDDPTSTVIESREGQLLGAHIARDGQWRFPETDAIPLKIKACVLAFEDKRFYGHPGVDPIALGRAMLRNTVNRRITSGGSTITMQLIRLSQKGRARTIRQKMKEMMLALRAEVRYDKEEILKMYVSHAPYGGNIVGLDAAAWRYYGRTPEELSWAEAATLTVLPNAPSLIFPGVRDELLLNKRNRLLGKLRQRGVIDESTYELSLLEPLPQKVYPIPVTAPHLLGRAVAEHYGRRVETTVDRQLQIHVNRLVTQHLIKLKANEIHNASVLVMSVESGEILAYTGNSPHYGEGKHSEAVDVITAPRSSGSILKPFLYAAMLDDGLILPNTLIPDIPTQIGGFSPRNFDLRYAGAVPASTALIRSLNIPYVRMLRDYGVEHFHAMLNSLGFSTISRMPSHYGLSLILGGAEVTLWELAGTYASLGRMLIHYEEEDGQIFNDNFRNPVYIQRENVEGTTGNRHIGERIKQKNERPLSDRESSKGREAFNDEETSILTVDFMARDTSGGRHNDKEPSRAANGRGGQLPSIARPLSAGAAWLTLEALREVNRPDEEAGWRSFSSSGVVAWKTGTSFGFRDAWAIGLNRDYIVAVWCGNADGEGRPELTGATAAAPLMFEIFSLLPSGRWFAPPNDELTAITVCRESGHRAGPYCEHTLTNYVLRKGLNSPPCPYHKLVHLDPAERWQVTSKCMPTADMIHKPWFVLPPVMEWYYKRNNPFYRSLPSFMPGCGETPAQVMDMIYPRENNQIFIPVQLDGVPGRAVLEVAHSSPEAVIYWHLNDEYLGQTTGTHQMAIAPNPGKHVITLIDNLGHTFVKTVEVVETRAS